MVLSAGKIFTPTEWAKLAGHLQLSAQQARIAEHLLEALSDKQIAHELGITVPTVRTYLGRMFTKLNVQDRNELVVRLFREFRAGCDECPRWR